MTTAPARASELEATWSQAERIASRRNEPVSTGHLLAALAGQPGVVSEIFSAFRLSTDRLREASAKVPSAHAVESPDRAQRILRAAGEFAQRTRSGTPAPVHLLVAALGERSCHAFRILEATGVDLPRLRTAAMQVALGVISPRRNNAQQFGTDFVEFNEPANVPVQQQSTTLATSASNASVALSSATPTPTFSSPSPQNHRPRGQAVRLIPEPRTTRPSSPIEQPTLVEPAPPTARTPSGMPPQGPGHQSGPVMPVAAPTAIPVTFVPTGFSQGFQAPVNPSAQPNGAPPAAPTSPAQPSNANSIFQPSPPSPSPAISPPMAAGAGIALLNQTSPSTSQTTPVSPGVLVDSITAQAVDVIPRNKPRARPARPTGNKRFWLDPSVFPVLSRHGLNLCEQALQKDAPSIVGREKEAQRCLDILAKRTENNPVLVGPPGVGKTSIVRAVAALATKAEPDSLDDRILVELVVGDLIAGTGIRGALTEKIQAIRAEIANSKRRVVLVVEDFARLIGDALDDEAGGELRQALQRGDIPLLATFTPELYRRLIEPDAVLSRCLAPIYVDEPSRADTLAILKNVSPSLSAHHNVAFGDDTLSSALQWTSRYLAGRVFPEKAISVLDLAGARAARRKQADVSPETLAHVVSELTDVPASRLLENDGMRLLSLEKTLSDSVVGHTEALSRIAALLRRSAAGLAGKRPLGTFLLLGPTGVGKTETAKALAACLFGSADAMTRLDLSEFSEPHNVARLIGAPPGYIGHEAGGQLTEAIRRRPYQVVLLDEIEKAHIDVLQTFLQVFDEGRLTDGRGRTVDFTQTVLILTSNIGATLHSSSRRSIGFNSDASSSGSLKESNRLSHPVIQAARHALPPELYNRIDEVLVFEPLTRDDVRLIASRLLNNLAKSLKEARGITVEFSPEVIDLLLDRGGFDPELGARPLKRAMATLLEAPLAERLLLHTMSSGDQLRVVVEASSLRFLSL